MNPAISVSNTKEAAASGGFLRLLAGLIPGVVLLAALGYAGKFTEQSIAAYGKAHHMALPNIEYVLWAIIFGLLVSNTIGVSAAFRPGVDTYEFWLKIGIVFQGVRFLMGDVLKLGGASLVFVAIELGVSIALMTWLRAALGLRMRPAAHTASMRRTRISAVAASTPTSTKCAPKVDCWYFLSRSPYSIASSAERPRLPAASASDTLRLPAQTCPSAKAASVELKPNFCATAARSLTHAA